MKKLLVLAVLLFSLPLMVEAQSVDLLWQGQSYTAPFYKGRTLWSKQALVTLVAIPQGLGNPATLDYSWSKNGTILGTLSGVGKNTLSFSDTAFSKPVNVKVEIIRGETTVVAEASMTLSPASPFLSVYEENPLYGFMFHREIGDGYKMEEAEATLAAFPFLFSVTNRNSPYLKYEWRTNSGGAEEGSEVTYRTPDEASGISQASVAASHSEAIMQNATRNLLIQFGEDD